MKNKENHKVNMLMSAINLKLLVLQKKASDWLNDKCCNLSTKTLMAILIIFCSGSACLLIMLIMGKL
jgi:hypothetical protein